MFKKKGSEVDYRSFENKFKRGEYISPVRLKEIMEEERFLDEHALDYNAPSAMPSPWQKNYYLMKNLDG